MASYGSSRGGKRGGGGGGEGGVAEVEVGDFSVERRTQLRLFLRVGSRRGCETHRDRCRTRGDIIVARARERRSATTHALEARL